MTARDDGPWTIEELGEQVSRALAVGYGGAPSARVRDVPDARTIRYYTTLGLLDRASSFAGRTALYGRRHLLQLVAIKKLQARGRSLAEIQERLVGATNSVLARLADVPDTLPPPPPVARAAEVSAAEERFWAEHPATTASPSAPAGPPARSPHAKKAARAAALSGVALGPQTFVVFPGLRDLSPEDVEALRAAATPLLDWLARRGLVEKP